MKVLKWSLLGVTLLLLVCQVTVSQLCKSMTVLMDGFHTLFILISIALASDAAIRAPPDPPPELLASPLHASNLCAESPVTKPRLGTRTLRQICPPALGCGLSYKQCRVPIVGSFVSALVLASLCLSSTIDIISLFLEPRQVWLPLLLLVISSYSVLLKMLFLWLYWDQFSDVSLQPSRGGVKGRAQPGRVLRDVDDPRLNGALVLCNPATSGPSDGDAPNPEPRGGARLPRQRGREGGAAQAGEAASPMPGECFTANLGRNVWNHNSRGNKSSRHVEEPLQKPDALLLSVCCVQVLGAAVLALISSAALLVYDPPCLRGSGRCSLMVYLDPGFSFLAMLILFATCIPQVSRYGMLLLQATPPHISVPDLQRRIESVPGVQAVHDLHIWELTELFWVASVHVHCHADFKTHRCSDLMSEVLKVLQSVGVSCCTIQPEFASSVQAEDASASHRPACSLACPKACAASMCCSPPEEKKLRPAAAATQQEPQPTDGGS